MAGILQQLREAVEASGRSQNSICKQAGIAPSQLSRLRAGTRTLKVEALEAVADALGFRLALVPKARKPSGPKPKGRAIRTRYGSR